MDINDYQVCFFDLDGLLVDTEPRFYHAFLEACQEYSLEVAWDFATYFKHTFVGRDNLSEKFLEEYPEARENLELIYKRREEIHYASLDASAPPLMPGVEQFLELIVSMGKRSGVVTNSSRAALPTLCKSYPIFNKFSFWVTREDYLRPKPYGDSYRHAYKTFVRDGEKVLGFEDSLKGLRALACIPATLIGINAYISITVEKYSEFAPHDFFFYPSFNELTEQCLEQNLS
ncbi:HAD family hydrolase [Candidatus Chlamydia sanziniae]|uniref:Haloacid dehalogenase n=1 Tax=Candidatus Chlamydia sanziniae TaxID=1806891 RepID=A0A1A9HVF0_9CHLA|nr:HAD family phosphatase [Candidatus Chlamydia sanziniae]ANH78381.1 haloacid dehalogenase [Candidatus Chlamydia sanziniae]